MIVITRIYKTLSPSGGCRNFVFHSETKCFDDDDKEGVENLLNTPVSELQKRECGYEIYDLEYNIEKF